MTVPDEMADNVQHIQLVDAFILSFLNENLLKIKGLTDLANIFRLTVSMNKLRFSS